MDEASIIILGIESSCDDTAAAVLRNGKVLTNITANQQVHEKYGGVVPELASRAHQQNIVPVVHQALGEAGVDPTNLNAIAFTRGPGLLGSLLVGTSFAKGLSLGLDIPMIEVNHMQAHVAAHYIGDHPPTFPFLCLTVSGGHTQIVLVEDHLKMKVIGQTLDDAAGECFDKAAKILGLPYPGGPLIDKHANSGDSSAFPFTHPRIENLDYSFSGLKTAILYFIRDQVANNENFIDENIDDLCASIQQTIIDILLIKLKKAAKQTGIQQIAIAGGVSANSRLRSSLLQLKDELGWKVYIPPFEYCTDNAAMIGMVGHYKYLLGEFTNQKITPIARYPL